MREGLSLPTYHGVALILVSTKFLNRAMQVTMKTPPIPWFLMVLRENSDHQISAPRTVTFQRGSPVEVLVHEREHFVFQIMSAFMFFVLLRTKSYWPCESLL